MYQFTIKKQDDGAYRMELGGIKLLVQGYSIKDGNHLIENPNKAIAYFNLGDNIYGISNEPWHYNTAEAFYDAIKKQFMMLIDKDNYEKANDPNLSHTHDLRKTSTGGNMRA